MIKNCYKFIFILFLVLCSSISNTFADLDLSRKVSQTYEVIDDGLDGLKFISKINKDGIALSGADFKFESDNGYCWLSVPTLGISYLVQRNNSAKRYYNNDVQDIIFKICGANWLTYGSYQAIADYNKNGGCAAGNCSAFANIKKYYPERGAFNGSYKFEVNKCIRNIHDCDGVVELNRCQKGSDSSTCIPIDGGINFNKNDRVYRENMYDGEEVINYDCTDPRPEARNYDIFRGGNKAYQTYYMRGFDAGNYACERFLEQRVAVNDEFDKAYQCCVKAQESVCIYQYEQNSLATFCSIYDNVCQSPRTSSTRFQVFKGNIGLNEAADSNKYCIKTYSLCPYNFNVEMGSNNPTEAFERIATESSIKKCQETENYDDCEIVYEKDECTDNGTFYPLCEGRNKNFLQYNRHCTIVKPSYLVEFTESSAYSPYIDKSCINLVGHSHNTTDYSTYYGYDKGIDRYPKTIFTPGIECFVETMKNLLMNRAGHTRCKIPSESPNYQDVCESGEEFKAGQEFDTDIDAAAGKDVYKHPLQDLIKYTRNIVYVLLTFAISLYGYNVIIKGGALGSRYDIMMLIIKITFIVTLTVNTSWYNLIFNFTYALNDTLFSAMSKMGFNTLIDSQGNLIKDDGCYFGDINSLRFSDDSPEVAEAISNYDNKYETYPSDRKYLAFFDALDCKIAKYFGYSLAEDGFGWGIVKLYVLTIIWPFGLGLFIGFISMFLGITLFVFALKVAYIYVASMVAITILLFLSPIIIPTILFKKFSGIFQKWLKNVIGYAIQPCILAAFISISIMIIDNFMLGDAFFTGKGPNKELVCGFACYDQDTGNLLAYTNKRSASVAYMLNNDMQDIEKQGLSKEQRDIQIQKVWVKVLTELEGKGIELDNCGPGDRIVDIKRNSPLCLMGNIDVELILGAIPHATDFFIIDVLSFLLVLILVFILNSMLNKVPRIASTLTGSAAAPGLGIDTNPFAIAGKAMQVLATVKRFSIGFVKMIINRSTSSNLKKKIAAQKDEKK